MQEHLQHIIRALPPNTKVLVVMAELPDGTHRITALPTSDFDHRATVPAAAASRLQVDGGDETVARRLARMQREHDGVLALKVKDWARLTGLSFRELSRAVAAGAIRHETKADGRDHAARTIEIDSMIAYIATVDAVVAGTSDTPPWWSLVRGKRAA